MKAIMMTRPGGTDVLQLADLADPVPGKGAVLVEVAAGVNFMDTWVCRGLFSANSAVSRPPPPFPTT